MRLGASVSSSPVCCCCATPAVVYEFKFQYQRFSPSSSLSTQVKHDKTWSSRLGVSLPECTAVHIKQMMNVWQVWPEYYVRLTECTQRKWERTHGNTGTNGKVRVEARWPKGLPFVWFITHRLFLDFCSLLYPLAGRQERRWDETRSADTGAQKQEGEEEENKEGE